MSNYRKITLDDRYQIAAQLQAGLNQTQIAKLLGFHKSTISREIKRNQGFRGKYGAMSAHSKTQARVNSQGRKFKITAELEDVVRLCLFNGWSPQQISERLRLERVEHVSTQTIYSYVKRNYSLRPLLRRRESSGPGRYLQRKYNRQNYLHIRDRPKSAKDRSRIGHWERDTMYTGTKEVFLVCTDRKTRYTKIAKLEGREAEAMNKRTRQLLESTGKKIYSITNDNGTEFKGKYDMGAPVYFCTPRTPQERGTVENTIGLLRQYVSKKQNTKNMEKEDIQHLEDTLNRRPRKCLGYRTPEEVFLGKKVALVS